MNTRLTPQTSNDVRAIAEAALLRDPEERGSFLDAACGGKPELRAQVSALLSTLSADSEQFKPPMELPSSAGEANTALAGAMIGPYILREELGRGGMGVVYLADDTRLGRRVALKALHAHIAAGAEQRERLRQEAKFAAALSHPGIATVYALEEFDGAMYLASEFVPGRTLRAVLQDGPVPLARLVDVATQIARVLAAAHAQGIVHRDLKPDNVMVTPAGVIKLLDFGLARSEGVQGVRLTHTGTVVGTPAYMAPEQLLGDRADFRVDLFALGVVIYEMASGANPFEAATIAATMDRVVRHEPPRLSAVSEVPAALDTIVQTCLRKRPAERYRSTEMTVGELDRIARQLATNIEAPARTAPAGSGATPRSRTPKSRWWWEFHQVVMSVLYVGMRYPVWRVGALLQPPWGTGFVFFVLTCATAATILRLNLRFTSRVYPAELTTQTARSTPWLRACDAAFAGALLIGGLAISSAHAAWGTLLVVASVGTVVAFAIIEPTTTRAAFRRRSSSVRIASPPRAAGRK